MVPVPFALPAILFVLASTGLFSLLFEYKHYLACAAPLSDEAGRRDKGVILWWLWWKSLVVFLPVLLGCGLLAWTQ